MVSHIRRYQLPQREEARLFGRTQYWASGSGSYFVYINAKRDCQKFVRRVSMVGIVIVSHSRELADSIVEFTKMMAPEALIRAAGGMDDGTLGDEIMKKYIRQSRTFIPKTECL